MKQKKFHKVYFANQKNLMYFLVINSAIETIESFYALRNITKKKWLSIVRYPVITTIR